MMAEYASTFPGQLSSFRTAIGKEFWMLKTSLRYVEFALKCCYNLLLIEWLGLKQRTAIFFFGETTYTLACFTGT